MQGERRADRQGVVFKAGSPLSARSPPAVCLMQQNRHGTSLPLNNFAPYRATTLETFSGRNGQSESAVLDEATGNGDSAVGGAGVVRGALIEKPEQGRESDRSAVAEKRKKSVSLTGDNWRMRKPSACRSDAHPLARTLTTSAARRPRPAPTRGRGQEMGRAGALLISGPRTRLLTGTLFHHRMVRSLAGLLDIPRRRIFAGARLNVRC
jgi:hypothetical protein